MRLYYWRGGRTMTCAGHTLLVLALSVVVHGQFQVPHAQPHQDPNPTRNRHPQEAQNTDFHAPSTGDADNTYNTANIKPPSDVIKAFESSLLKMFGLKTRPRPSRQIHVPQYMLDLYNSRAQNSDDLSDSYYVHGTNTYSANTIRSFFHSEDEENRRHQDDIAGDIYKRRFYFNMTDLPAEETLTAAEFRLYRQTIYNTSSLSGDGDSAQSSSDNQSDNLLPQEEQTNLNTRRKYSKHRIAIYEVLRPATKTREAITRLLDTRVVEPWRTNWESFDIRPAVQKWRDTPHRNHGLEVHVQGHGRALPALTDSSASNQPHVRLRRSLHTSESQWHKQKPMVVTYSDDGASSSKSRSKRKARHKKRSRSWSKKHRKDECRRHHLYVDFGDVGWNDWIVAPPGYQAYYCSGECGFPLPEYINTTNHAIVQTLVHSVSPQAVPKPCCVPTELSPISMLYLDESEKVVLKNYQDMVVVGCGCR